MMMRFVWSRAPRARPALLALLLALAACQLAAGLPQRRPSRQAAPAETTTTAPADEPADATNAATSAAAATTTTSSTSTTTTATPQASKSGKYPPVNFTLVEQLFNAALDEAQVVEKWRQMDKTLTESVRAVLKIVFPHIVSMSSDAKVSGNCSGAILKWILNLRNMREWAVRMLDAIGKPSAGLLEGSLTLFGNYKQCLRVRAPDEDEIEASDGEQFSEYFRGQYCVLQLRPPLPERRRFYSLNSTIEALARKSYKYYEKTAYDSLAELAMAFQFVSIRADLCVPSLCSRDDIQRVADYLANKVNMRARVQRCDVEPADSAALIEQSHLIWSMIFVILLLLVLVSTLTSVAFKLQARRRHQLQLQSACKGSRSKSIFTSLSVYRSLSRMKNVRVDRINDSKPVLLYALRLLLILWIFLVSLVSQLDFQYLREMLSLRSVIMQWPLQLLVNSTLQFDALILLTAFTYSYQNINSNLADLIKYNVSKYTRLMPSIMLLVAITIITPLLYQNRSPIWADFVNEPAQVCKSNGLINLTFLQNLLSSSQICLPQTWIFCVELQLCVLAIPFVRALNKQFDAQQGRFKPLSLPVLLLGACALLGAAANFANVYLNMLPAAWFLTFPDKLDRELYFSAHLYKTWSHVSAFAVGLLAGHLCRCLSIRGRSFGAARRSDQLLLLSSLACMAALIFGTHSWSLAGRAHLEAPLACAAYAGLAPLLWAVCWSALLFVLTVPRKSGKHFGASSGLIQLIASDVNVVRIGRLSFLAYLLNPFVNNFVLAVQEQAIFSSVLMLGHTFIGNLVITFALAFLVSALVELPCRCLFKKLLIGSRGQSTNLDIIARQLNVGQPAGGGGAPIGDHHHHHQHLAAPVAAHKH